MIDFSDATVEMLETAEQVDSWPIMKGALEFLDGRDVDDETLKLFIDGVEHVLAAILLGFGSRGFEFTGKVADFRFKIKEEALVALGAMAASASEDKVVH